MEREREGGEFFTAGPLLSARSPLKVTDAGAALQCRLPTTMGGPYMAGRSLPDRCDRWSPGARPASPPSCLPGAAADPPRSLPAPAHAPNERPMERSQRGCRPLTARPLQRKQCRLRTVGCCAVATYHRLSSQKLVPCFLDRSISKRALGNSEQAPKSERLSIESYVRSQCDWW